MKKALTTIPFKGTAEQEKQLREMVVRLKNTKGSLMPILQEAQAIYGYLPIEVQKIIAEELDMPLEEIYGVVTFYAQFSLNPKGKYNIGVCLGTACYVKGSQSVFDKCSEVLGIGAGGVTPDGKFSFEATRCVGCCGLAPVLTVNEDVYGKLTADMVPGIIKKYQ